MNGWYIGNGDVGIEEKSSVRKEVGFCYTQERKDMYSREFRQVASSLIVLGFSSKIGIESKTPKDK